MASDLSRYSLPPRLAEVARRELNETPAARNECLIQLRQRLRRPSQSSTDNPICYNGESEVDGEGEEEEEEEEEDEENQDNSDASIPDDRFLLRFLRSKKFDVQRSYAMYERYREFLREHPAELDPQAVRHVWDAGVIGGLRERDIRGRSVIVAFPGRWDPAAHALEDVLRAMLLQLEYMIESEETQVRGIVLVADFTRFSFYQMRCLKPWYFQTMATLMQNAFPARFKGVYIVNQPWYISAPLSLIRPFLTEKLKRRINLLGRQLKALERHFQPEVLPKEFGGLSGAYTGPEWSELIIHTYKQNSSRSSSQHREVQGGEEEEEEEEGRR